MFKMAVCKRVTQGLAFTCLLLSAGSARSQTLLRWKFQPGETLHYLMTSQMVEKAQIRDKPVITVSVTFAVDDLWKIESVDDKGVATVHRTIDRVRLKLQGPPGAAADYDSAASEESTGMAKMFAKVLGVLLKRVTVLRINTRGEILEAKPPEGLLEDMRKVIPTVTSFGDFFSAQGERKMQINIQFPESPVTKGQTWTTKDDSQLPAVLCSPLSVEYEYKYVGPGKRDGRDIEKLAITTRLSSLPPTPASQTLPAAERPATDQPEKEPSAPMVKFKATESDGTIDFDNVHGRILQANVKLQIQAALNIMGQQGTLDVDGTVHMELQSIAAKPSAKR